MIEKHIDVDFDVDEVSFKINNIMSKWSAHLIDRNGCDWIIYNYDMDIICLFHFQIDFNDLEMRIKLEDLTLLCKNSPVSLSRG